MESLLIELDALMTRGDAPDFEGALGQILEAFDCVTGTLHAVDEDGKTLRLVAQRGIPSAVLERVQQIPVGKGMAGIAAERREPVQVCNLQTDDSGVARPAAKETRMEGSIACPVLIGPRLCGTLGVAKPTSYEFTEAERELLMKAGTVLGRWM